MKIMRSLFLTFDVEDFINKNSIPALHKILELLKKHELHALFFVTGHMAEKLAFVPQTTDLLNEHQIGYHTSSHSVHPTAFEFTDVKSYEKAYQNSFIRETTHINPLTGAIEGAGGITALQSLFPKKRIVSFRAPGFCWIPPHLEALKAFGISYDFSTNISANPISYRDVTFYPYPLFHDDWRGGFHRHVSLQKCLMLRKVSVLNIHPSKLVNKLDWDLIYYSKSNNVELNPEKLVQLPPRNPLEVSYVFNRFEQLLKHLKNLQWSHFLAVTPPLKRAKSNLHPTITDVEKYYQFSIIWAKGFGYNPRFLYDHFTKFFGISS
jgi:peptidoglycan/xylan/chitin deacetylase (PgdA/CDA1 family)